MFLLYTKEGTLPMFLLYTKELLANHVRVPLGTSLEAAS
jgi:hypothetical protein